MRNGLLLLMGLGISILLSCTSLPDVDSTPANQIKPAQISQKRSIIDIRRRLKNSAPEANIEFLTKERDSYKGTEFESEIESLLAQELIKVNNGVDAGLAYLRAARSNPLPDQRLRFCEQAARTFQKIKDWDRLKKGIDFCLTRIELPKEGMGGLKEIELSAYDSASVSPVERAKVFVNIMAFSKGPKESEYRNKALQVVDQMSLNDLQEVIGDSDFGFLRGHAAFKLGQLQMSQQNPSQAKSTYSLVIQYLPETELAEIAQRRIEQIELSNQVNPSTIGAILPLSGKHGNLGERVLRGLQIGLGLDGEGYSPIRLSVMDSEGNPDLARQGVEKLVHDDNVIGIVGSLLSKTANAVADQAQVMDVPNIALSQRAGVTEIGENIFRYGLTSETQVRYLVKRAMKDLGLKRFAIIYPNDKFGVEYANLFWDEVLARGGEIRGAQVYDSDEIDFSDAVQRLIGTYYQEERLDEIRWRNKKSNEKHKVVKIREKAEQDLLPPALDFDAIFVADGIKPLGQISAMLSYNGVKGIKILGTNLWNNPAITKRISNTGNQILFVDGPSIDSSVLSQSLFAKQFRRQFSQDPGPFEIQGFEAGLLIGRALSDHVRSRADFRSKLNTLPTFLGVNGTISKINNREFSKQLLLYTLDMQKIKPFESK